MTNFTRGGWVFNPKTLVIEHPRTDYYINLERCTSPAEILDWIAQLRTKEDFTDLDVGHAVALLDDLLHFQENYCGWGRSRRARPVAILEARLGRPLKQRRKAAAPAD
jgi:hypothetical protein